MHDDREELKDAMTRLGEEVALLNSHRFVQLHNKPVKMIMFQFMRGLAFGLGSAVGATMLVSLAAWWLSQFEFLPIVGDWARQIADQIAEPR
jgi:sugar phosphate isomerase/epimerase